MFLFRNVEKSVYHQIAALFTNPTGGLSAFRVYGEDKFFDDAFKPIFPYLFLMGYRVPPRETRLPLIILDSGQNAQSYFEVGTRGGTYWVTTLNIFARNRAERDDLAGYLYQTLNVIPVYDYSADEPVFKYNTLVEGKSEWRAAVKEDIGMEGALSNWSVVQFSYQLVE